MKTTRTTAVIALLCACLAGALVRDLRVSRAAAGDADQLRRSDIDRVVRALEKQADGTHELVGAMREAGRQCHGH
jgi:hypothetical protein